MLLVQSVRQRADTVVRPRVGAVVRAAVLTLVLSALIALAVIGWLAWREFRAERCLLGGGRVQRGVVGVSCQAPTLP